MKQYKSIKEEYPDAILLFRLGDFYEMFFDDARTASPILQIALTSRDKSKDDPIPMCGIPYFSAESYIAKLIRAGLKVAVCEQVEDPREAKGIVKREVVRVITPGTHAPERPKENAYIMSFAPLGGLHGVAVADVSTGEFFVFETAKSIEDEIAKFDPKEILFPESLKNNIHYAVSMEGRFCTPTEDALYDYSQAYRTLLKHFRVTSLEGFGCDHMNVAIQAGGALINYLETIQKEPLYFSKITVKSESSHMFIDASTQKNLELVKNLRNDSVEGSLLWALDETLTAMGGRFIRNAIMMPLLDIDEIKKRQSAVGAFLADYELVDHIRTTLRKIQDIERLERKIAVSSANARDLVALKLSLSALPELKQHLNKSKDDSINAVADSIADFPKLLALIDSSIIDTPSASLREGGIIKDGFEPEIDELRSISRHGKDFIAKIEADERKATGIQNLKVGYNRVFGYFIEVTKSNLEQVPDRFIRKQTLVGGERFITPELKEYETKVLGAEERLKDLEYYAFMRVLSALKEQSQALLSVARKVAEIDFYISLSVVAKRNGYVMPVVDKGLLIEIVEGRHPVLEKLPSDDKFIPNSLHIDGGDDRLLIVTGPNMAGKSTFMRQSALIILMAQMGSFVPAEGATIGVVDRIFTRIGASDYLVKGQSTFMVEMIETSNILNNATERSFILLDEIGRGTSTFDGISIAWAAAEYIIKNIRARTLFATHYNELTELALTSENVRNYNVLVREWGDSIVFLRKIVPGPADKSYGIQVGRLAGLPDKVIARAKEVLANLEKESLNYAGQPRFAPQSKQRARQLNLFAAGEGTLIEILLSLDTDALSPEDALKKLRDLKKRAGTA